MSTKYKFHDQTKPYFVTMSVINWMDVFTRPVYRNVIVQSLKYCQKEKGLEIYAWCLMTNHLHLIIGTKGVMKMEDILRDFKSFTSRSIRKILEDKTFTESRRLWMLSMVREAGMRNSNNRDFQFWQQNNHPLELDTNNIMDQKLEYLHANPVEAGFVDSPDKWRFSSAQDYFGTGIGEIDIIFME